jgi:hypothetical protein
MTTTLTPVPSYREAAIADGYVYECSCGELYNSVAAAKLCRKCRNYCVFGYCTHVVDIRTAEVVAGEEPSAEEYEVARVAAEAKWAEEKAELELYAQMCEEAGPLYEAEMARQAEEAAVAARELAIDRQFKIQDILMGY